MDEAEMKQAIALTALNSMFDKGYFDICCIDKVAKLLAVQPAPVAYAMLAPLHCINWNKMPAEVRDAVPLLIKQALGVGPVFQFKGLEPEVIDITPTDKPRGFLRLLRGSTP